MNSGVLLPALLSSLAVRSMTVSLRSNLGYSSPSSNEAGFASGVDGEEDKEGGVEEAGVEEEEGACSGVEAEMRSRSSAGWAVEKRESTAVLGVALVGVVLPCSCGEGGREIALRSH